MLASLQETLGVGDDSIFRSGSALAGGVARRGETCGALTAAIMAIGCIIGRDKLEDRAQYVRAMEVADQMYERFKQKVGHTLCAEIHLIKYGRVFHLHIPEESRAFHESGGHSRTGCPEVCGIAAEIAADIILDLQERQ